MIKRIGKIQRFLVIQALACVGLIVLFLILAIFKISNAFTWKIVLSLLYIFAGSIFGMNAFNFAKKNKIFAFVSITFILLSVIGALLATFLNVPAVIIRIVGTFAILTAFMVIFIGTILKAEGRFKTIQLIIFILTVMIDIVLTIIVWGGAKILENVIVRDGFIIGIIVDAALIITINILSKKVTNEEDTITITKEEYRVLKEKADIYDKMVKNDDRK